MTIRVLIADDQANIRAAFRIILDAQPDMTVVGEAADGTTAIELARDLRPDVVLADIRMPGADGLEVTRALCGPEVTDPIRVVVVTTFDLDEYVHGALRNGASGFLLKRSGPQLLTEAIRAAVDGDALISPQLTLRLLSHIRSGSRPEEAPALQGRGHTSSGDKPALTDRESQIAGLIAEGRTTAEIAATLFITPGTVKNHTAAIQRKLGTRNRVGIALWVNRHCPP